MALSADTLAAVAAEAKWLIENPAFLEKPASISEFLGPGYLNCEGMVRARIRDELVQIFGEEVNGRRPTAYPLAIITGGIGIGKTTVASIALPYLVHWVLCLKDPQRFYNMLAGSRIAFMQMSTSEKQALNVVFGDIKARIVHSPWFRKHPFDPAFKNQLRFEKDVWILPGDSHETTFEGYNILGGILDEADSHIVTAERDYAEQGYTTIDSRVSSRFQDRGFLLVIGQMKSATGFAARKFEEFSARPDAYACRLAIWESMGDEFYRAEDDGDIHKFAYDMQRKQIIPDQIAKAIHSDSVTWIPELYRRQFENAPEKALRDLAGMPPLVGDPFISLPERILVCRDRWVERYGDGWSPYEGNYRFSPAFVCRDPLKRVAHLDLAYSPDGDALGFAMGHVPEMRVIDGERKPYIVIDCLVRIKARAGGEIFLADVRRLIYELRDERKFKIDLVTMDGFQSTDTRQQLERRRFGVDYVSADKQLLPYEDLREAIYEYRIEFPPYFVEVEKNGLHSQVEILVKELGELEDDGKKVDHPLNGSKDVADAVACVCFNLMGDRRYHRKVVSMADYTERQDRKMAVGQGSLGRHHAFVGDGGLSAPLPPADWSNR